MIVAALVIGILAWRYFALRNKLNKAINQATQARSESKLLSCYIEDRELAEDLMVWCEQNIGDDRELN